MARARVVSRRPRRLFRTLWLAERRTFRQGLVALALSTPSGFVAGLRLGHLAERLEAFPGLLILNPATFRLGLDPDDQTVPTLTSAVDLAGIACVLVVGTSIGVLARG